MKNFIKEFLESKGYTITEHRASEYNPEGKCYGKSDKGMDSADWNEDGNYIRLYKDARTRVVFSGVVNTPEELELLLKLVR